MRFFLRTIAGALGGVLLCQNWLSPSQAPPPASVAKPGPAFVLEGHRHYYAGRPKRAIASYQQALKRNPADHVAWLNGAVIWSDLGSLKNAEQWYQRAAALLPDEPKTLTALGEVKARLGKLEQARAVYRHALETDPDDVYALTALGRVELASGRPRAALSPLAKAVRLEPNLTLAHFFLGKAREEAGDDVGAIEAYKNAAFTDSYFTQARLRLSRAFVRMRRFHEAWEQIGKLISAAPLNKNFQRLEREIRPRLKDSPRPFPSTRAALRAARAPLPMAPPPKGKVPILRIGVATNGMGEPLTWHGFKFTGKTRFSIAGVRSGRILVQGRASRRWTLRVTKNRYMEIRDAAGNRRLRTRRPLRIRPDIRRGGWTYIKELSGPRVKRKKPLGRTLRGELEVSLFPGARGVKIVNIVNLESYTQGVLTAEMPITSPMEALKAQAVIARTHALFMKKYRTRHKRHGYDLCDGQHCQVYYGIGSETERSRSIVRATRGRVITYQGKIADVLYSSNCGGHTQSAADIKGWHAVPYFTGIPDAPATASIPRSPWALRQWLKSTPPSYCSPSSHVYPSHYRWTRVIAARDLEARINRSVRVGRLEGIVPLKRSASGHLNAILIRGSRGEREITSEMRIRGLFGIGSQRSSLFVLDTEYDAKGRPQSYIFYGGGWGHGVGMCQSGAMGRAEKGQSYAEILQAYFRGIEIGNLRY